LGVSAVEDCTMKNRDSLLFVGLLVVATLAGIWGAQQVASQNEGDTGVAEFTKSRVLTLALLTGIIIGYIIGHLVPMR